MADDKSKFEESRLNQSILSSSVSQKKYTKFREWQINEDNKIILKKLGSVKASPELSNKKLFHKYSTSDLKYRTNLQKNKCIYCLNSDKNIDYSETAQKLLKGEKIKFTQIRMGSIESENKEKKR